MHRHTLRTRANPERPRGSVLRELREGLVVLAGAAALRVGLLQLTVSLVVVTTMFALGPAYVHRVLGRPPEDTYQLLIPATGGLVFTAVALGRGGARRSRARLLILGSLVCGVILMATGVVPGWVVRSGHEVWLTPLVLVMSTAFGCAIGALLIVAFTVVQEGTDEATRGRIFGGIFAVINAATALPLLLAGGLADAVGVDWVVFGLGGMLVVYGALAATVGRTRLQLIDRSQIGIPVAG
jgi:MFS family permease